MLTQPAAIFRRLHENEMCTATLIGSAIEHLASVGLWPVPETADYRGSIKELDTKLSPNLSLVGKGCDKKHNQCDERLKSMLLGPIDRDTYWSLPDFHYNRLKAQAKRSGVEEEGWQGGWSGYDLDPSDEGEWGYILW